jgi:DNA-binding FadR family transcriptional regulator
MTVAGARSGRGGADRGAADRGGADGAGLPRGRARKQASGSERLQQQIKDLILTRGLAAGDPLPTEFELVDEFGVSRNSLREALKALQAVGIVEIRHGFGMYVGRMSLDALVDELTFHSRITLGDSRNELAHLIEIREILECGLLRRLIDQHPEADHSDVAAVIDQMVIEVRDDTVAPETDRRFHEVLYQPLDNPLVPQLLGAFWDVYQAVKDQLGPAQEDPADVARRHRKIYQAVLDRDQDAAAAAMVAHFDGVRGRLAAAKPADSGA